MKKFYGKYALQEEARRAVEELLDRGLTRDQIRVVSRDDLGGNLRETGRGDHRDQMEIREQRAHDGDRSVWEKIKDAFTFDQYDDEYWDRNRDDRDLSVIENYRDDLAAGETVILVDEDANTMPVEGMGDDYKPHDQDRMERNKDIRDLGSDHPADREPRRDEGLLGDDRDRRDEGLLGDDRDRRDEGLLGDDRDRRDEGLLGDDRDRRDEGLLDRENNRRDEGLLDDNPARREEGLRENDPNFRDTGLLNLDRDPDPELGGHRTDPEGPSDPEPRR